MRHLDSNPFGYFGGPDEKIVRFTGGDPLANVDRDATNLWYRPGDAAQWNAVAGVAGCDVPVSAYGMQELSGGTIADLVGTKPLTISGAVAFQVAIAGASTKGIGGSATATNQLANNSTVANINAVDVAFLLYAVRQAPTVGHQVASHGAASGNAFEGVAGSSIARIRNGAPALNGSLAHLGLRPYFVLCRKGAVNALWSDIEELSIADNAGMAGAVFSLQFRIAADVSTSTVFNYGARWEGSVATSFGANLAAARVKVKTLLQTLGHVVTGY